MNKPKLDLVASYVGTAWSAVMSVAFVPLYVRYLGIESYGLVGLFASLQAWMALLDMGITPTITREMARFRAGGKDIGAIWDLLASLERVYFFLFVISGVAIVFVADWLAFNWLVAEQLSPEVITHALIVMGWVIGLRWMSGLYRGAIMGLQTFVWLNSVLVIFASVRAIGSIAVLVLISPTIGAFFAFQGVVSGFELLVLARKARVLLPAPIYRPKFSVAAIRSVWRFSMGMGFLAVLSLLLRQADKLILSALLSLSNFGYYAVAVSVAGLLSLMTAAISDVFYPRLSELVFRKNNIGLTNAYHDVSQLLAIILFTCGSILAIFAEEILWFWSGDATLVAAAPLVSVLAVANLLNGLVLAPYLLQLAHGETKIQIICNVIAVGILIPSLLVFVPLRGANAAAWIWLALNIGYLVITVPIVHRKYLPSATWKWYFMDVMPPAITSFTLVFFIRLMGTDEKQGISTAQALVSGVFLLGATLFLTTLSTPLGRRGLAGWWSLGRVTLLRRPPR